MFERHEAIFIAMPAAHGGLSHFGTLLHWICFDMIASLSDIIYCLAWLASEGSVACSVRESIKAMSLYFCVGHACRSSISVASMVYKALKRFKAMGGRLDAYALKARSEATPLPIAQSGAKRPEEEELRRRGEGLSRKSLAGEGWAKQRTSLAGEEAGGAERIWRQGSWRAGG